MELKDFLAWFTTAGAALAAYWLVEHWPWAQRQAAEAKRLINYAVAFVLADLAYLGMIGLSYAPLPEGIAWAEVLFLVGTTAFGFSQLVHGRAVLSKR